jgi:hypothetical protein
MQPVESHHSQGEDRRDDERDIEIAGNEVKHADDGLVRPLNMAQTWRGLLVPVHEGLVHQTERDVGEDVNELEVSCLAERRCR